MRVYYAPVRRDNGTPAAFDPAVQGRFALSAPPVGWTDLGYVSGLKRKSVTKVMALESGAPMAVRAQTRTGMGAEVSFTFNAWGKLQMGLSAGSQQMNLLAASAAGGFSGGSAVAAQAVLSRSTATSLVVADASGFTVGDVVAVDVDHAGETGFVGAGASAAYVKAGSTTVLDADYVRRVTFNVGRVIAIAGSVMTLGLPLLAGVPSVGMKVAKVLGFVDREGGSFFHEWSALFVADGIQGDRVIYHYPRLQSAAGAAEEESLLVAKLPLQKWSLTGAFRALPVVDANDGEQALCYRSYLPAAMRMV